MKFKHLSLVTLSVLAVSAVFTSCSSDDSWSAQDQGSKIEMAQTRAFVLNEGSYGKNNAGMTYFDWTKDAAYTSDLFTAQNSTQMGDTGQDIIVGSDGSIYAILSGSKVIYKMNSVGVRQLMASIDAALGDPRYMVEKNGYLYVTCYGGFVAKVNMQTLKVEDKVAVGPNPEYIVEKDNKVYCTCSGWGADKRVAIIDLASFKTATYNDVMDNPDNIIVVNNRIFVQGYGAAYDYPWGELKSDGSYTKIGNCSKWGAYGNKLYTAYSETDWSTYATTTTFKVYDATSSQLSDSPFKNAPAELATSSVYGISTNPYNGDIYVMTSDYVTNGNVYHFKADGTYVTKFAATGISPRKIVFLN